MPDRNEIEPRPVILKLRERKERHQQRSKPYRIAFGTVGVLMLLVGGVLALPLVPGPGLIFIAVGLGMLALEFDRAERLLERILDRIGDVADETSPVQKALILGAGTVLLVVGLAFALVWDVPLLPV
jgi:Putative transmembrane protein (PGPGW)